ncbi:hypothetical protein [Rhodoferax sp. UBA5149]|uniref:hypothetical protein n=1 Tax=Rhodoferax sp. UBA5149 TaxID=1947379 RepID=UPI0025CE74E7|nr:hypothetical protein [Rhodoferax sp. UBA5149]
METPAKATRRRHSAAFKRKVLLLPAMIDPTPPVGGVSVAAPGSGSTTTRVAPVGVIEIEFGGARVRLHCAVDEASVRCVLQTLRDTT